MDIEKTILSQLFLCDKSDQIEFYSQLGESYFYDWKWKNYFNAIGRIIIIHKEKLDSLSIYNEVGKEDWYSHSDLADLQSASTSIADIGRNVAILKERHYRKELVKTLDQKVEELKLTKWHDELEEAKNNLIASIDSIGIDFGSDFIDFGRYEDVIKKNMDSENVVEGYSWGIDVLDSITNGITVPKLVVLGGLKKGGKSRFVINTRYALKEQGVYSPFISLEMPAMELTKLHYARELRISDNLLRSGSLLSAEQVQIVKNHKMDWKYFPTECIASLKIEDILSRIRKYSKLFPGCVIFIDYLQRILHNRENQATALEGISNQIADATRDYNVTVVLLSQLQNIAERETPTIGHLKGSGGIGESADVIMLLDNLYRRSKEDETKKGKFKIYIEQRYGESGVVDIAGNLGISEYADIYRYHEHFEEEK